MTIETIIERAQSGSGPGPGSLATIFLDMLA